MKEKVTGLRNFRAMAKAISLAIIVALPSCTLPTASNTESCPKGVTGLVTPGPETIGGFTNYLSNVDWSVTQCPPYPSKKIRIESTDPATLRKLIDAAHQACQIIVEKRLNKTSVDLTTTKENCLLKMQIQ